MYINVRNILAICIFTFGTHCFANFIGNDTQNFNPTSSGIDFVTVHSTEVLAPEILNTGLFFNQAGNVLPETIDFNGVRIASKDRLTFGDLSVAYGFDENWELGLNFSYLLSQETNRNEAGAQFSATGLNEIRIGGKYNFMSRSQLDGHRFGGAVIFSVNMNQSANNPFAGVDAGPTYNLETAFDKILGDTLVAANIGYRFRNSGAPIRNSVYKPIPNQYIASIAANRYFPESSIKLIAELLASKLANSVDLISADKISTEAILGIKYDAQTNTSVHLGGGTKVTEGLFTPDWRIYGGLSIAFDLKEKSVSSANSVAHDNGTTEIYLQTSKGYLPRDIEALKKIPFDDIIQTAEFNLRKTVPEKGFDGEKPPFEVIRIDNFDFEFASSQIRPEYFPLLENVGAYLASKPTVLKIRVEGHTDSIGSPERNRKRSQERADAVMKYLKDLPQLSTLEIESVGYGSDRPIADNGNFQGRKQNRRVEIRILRQTIEPKNATQKIIVPPDQKN